MCLLAYLQAMTAGQLLSALFVLHSGVNKGKKALKASIARWIRQVIVFTYEVAQQPCPLKITAHSARSVATSWAKRAEASL